MEILIAATAVKNLVGAITKRGVACMFTPTQVHGFRFFGGKGQGGLAGTHVGPVTPGLFLAFATGTPHIGFARDHLNGNGFFECIFVLRHEGPFVHLSLVQGACLK